MRPSLGLVLIPCATLAGCGGTRSAQQEAATLAGATRVEVFRIDGGSCDKLPAAPKPGEEANVVGGYVITARGPDQGAAFADKLAAILSDPSTYARATVGCHWPGVAFRVWKDGHCVEVLICFLCDNLYCGPPKDRPRPNGVFPNSPRRRDLVRLVKEAFPGDPQIQALEEVHEWR